MRNLFIAAIVVLSPMWAAAQDTSGIEALEARSRPVDPRSVEAMAFLRAYGTPSDQLIQQQHWGTAVPPQDSGLVRFKLSASGTVDAQPFILLVNPELKLMYLVRQQAGRAVAYGPVAYPRGI